MGMTKNDEKIIGRLFHEAVAAGKRNSLKDKFKQTEKRLYAYPIMKRNIERYALDIKDIEKEDMKKSKDFVIFLKNSGGADKPDLEELRAAKILVIEQKRARDEKEIAEIDAALKEIEQDEYFSVIEMHYFQGAQQDEVAEKLHCDKVTAWRNRKRLINMLNISLYGADAL